jgi:ribosomal protein S18 acetylase RimI-like enzyme
MVSDTDLILKHDTVRKIIRIYTLGEKEVGLLSYRRFPGGLVIEVCMIYTNQEFQRKGYATFLLKKLIELNPEYSMLYLHTTSTNKPAIAFYEAFGFKKAFDWKDFYEDPSSGEVHDSVFYGYKIKH